MTNNKISIAVGFNRRIAWQNPAALAKCLFNLAKAEERHLIPVRQLKQTAIDKSALN